MRNTFLIGMMLAAVCSARCEQLSVAQLTSLLEQRLPKSTGNAPMDRLSEDRFATELEKVVLTERLTNEALDQLQARLQPGPETLQTLEILAARSSTLETPEADRLKIAEPSAKTQKDILELAQAFSIHRLKRLPNFFAQRTTQHYEGVPSDMNTNPELLNVGVAPHGQASVEITFREGHEVLDPMGKQKTLQLPLGGMATWGEFGLEPAVVLNDALRSTIAFDHWENAATGIAAVFRYAVPRQNAHYAVQYSCAGGNSFEDLPAYHGSLAIDPTSGAIVRVTVITEWREKDPLTHVASVIEYAPVNIGDKSFVCPSHSAALMVEEPTACPRKHANSMLAQPVLMINRTSFTEYHRLGSTIRFLPSEGEPAPASEKKDGK